MNAKRKLLALSAVILCASRSVQADLPGAAVTTLAAFTGTNGTYPYSGVAADAAGDLFGTTYTGGTYSDGTAYELSGANHKTFNTLYNFNLSTGWNPRSGLTVYNGNLFGTVDNGPTGVSSGTVLELSGPNHTTLNTFGNFPFLGPNGSFPQGPPVFDSSGNMYGITSGNAANGSGGVLFKMSGTNYQTIQNQNALPSNSWQANTGLSEDSAGNLYGETVAGTTGYGNVYEFSGTNHQTLTVLANFNGSNGSKLQTPLAFDPAGNIYGVTYNGGTGTVGTVFELSGPTHQILTTLVNFNTSSGNTPGSGLTFDSAGDIFGTTQFGGTYNQGTVFELSGAGHQTYTTIFSFNGTDGSIPVGTVVADAAGDLYGTTQSGTNNDGTVFELTGSGFVVPEPTSLSLLAISGIAMLRRRRRGAQMFIALDRV